jgi:hypothetical protein
VTIINLTPHEVRIIRHGVDDIVYPPSGDVARLGTIELGGGEFVQVEFHHLENPPTRKDGVRYIVSLPTALASPRGDFLVPYREVRDDDGRIIGCRMLAQPV